MGTYYDRQGRTITIQEFGQLCTTDYKRVARTELPELDAVVSTVWLGLNHRYGDGPPLIFESMVFGGGLDQFQRRYSTEEQAGAGHEDVVVRVKAEAADFAHLVADPRVLAAVRVLEACMDAHTREHWGETGLDNGELYARLAKAVTG